jgi:hypothetical protein
LLCVPKRRNPKGVALFILGLLEDFSRLRDVRLLAEATALGAGSVFRAETWPQGAADCVRACGKAALCQAAQPTAQHTFWVSRASAAFADEFS